MGISSLAACHISLFWLSHRLFALWWINFSLSLCLSLSLSAERAASVTSSATGWRGIVLVLRERSSCVVQFSSCAVNTPLLRQVCWVTVRLTQLDVCREVDSPLRWLSVLAPPADCHCRTVSVYTQSISSLHWHFAWRSSSVWLNVFIMTSDKPQMKLQCMYK